MRRATRRSVSCRSCSSRSCRYTSSAARSEASPRARPRRRAAASTRPRPISLTRSAKWVSRNDSGSSSSPSCPLSSSSSLSSSSILLSSSSFEISQESFFMPSTRVTTFFEVSYSSNISFIESSPPIISWVMKSACALVNTSASSIILMMSQRSCLVSRPGREGGEAAAAPLLSDKEGPSLLPEDPPAARRLARRNSVSIRSSTS
mmetsp:Transcript_8040/g.13485  ORF Transcript_8040/g.13485 Transcript_8040/m.13485 type:complete len:205 (-) Transcript_8040:617-1231(-)